MEKERAEKLAIAALSNNETNGPSHEELKILVWEILVNQCNFAKFATTKILRYTVCNSCRYKKCNLCQII